MRWNEKRILGIFDRTINEECTHCTELKTLERLSQYICPNLFHRTVLQIKFMRIVVMVNEEIF
jgi:hypothetical protein